jgi:hypothetical protein
MSSGRRQRASVARDALRQAHESGASQHEATRAIGTLRTHDASLYEVCEQLILAGKADRALKLLEAASEETPRSKVAVAVGVIALLVVGGIAVSVWIDERDAATITTRSEACRAELVEVLETFRDERGMAYETGELDAQEILDAGRITKTYERDAVRHRAKFRVEYSDGVCQLTMYQRVREARSTERERGRFGSISLSSCSCESS